MVNNTNVPYKYWDYCQFDKQPKSPLTPIQEEVPISDDESIKSNQTADEPKKGQNMVNF